MEIAETLRELEASLLAHVVRKDAKRVAALLADEFREFGKSGSVYSKAEIIALLRAEEEIDVLMTEFACTPVAQGVALVTYCSHELERGAEKAVALRSSVWVLRDGRWQMVFHQGTPRGLPLGEQSGAPQGDNERGHR